MRSLCARILNIKNYIIPLNWLNSPCFILDRIAHNLSFASDQTTPIQQSSFVNPLGTPTTDMIHWQILFGLSFHLRHFSGIILTCGHILLHKKYEISFALTLSLAVRYLSFNFLTPFFPETLITDIRRSLNSSTCSFNKPSSRCNDLMMASFSSTL